MALGGQAIGGQAIVGEEIWVFDTSSIIELKVIFTEDIEDILAKLEVLVAEERLGFPVQVRMELERRIDALTEWATRIDRDFLGGGFTPADHLVAEVKAKAKNVVDMAKPLDEQEVEADPFILAMALQLQRGGHNVTVVTEENREYGPSLTRPEGKISLKTAGGLLGIRIVKVRQFLEEQGWL